MYRRFEMLLLLLFVYLLPGCGTVANLQGHKDAWNDVPEQVSPKPFGGVERDSERISSGNYLFAADIPFSLVGDVVSLPKVLSKPDPVQEAIKKGEILEDQGWLQHRTMNPSVVLKFIPSGTPIEQAKSFMEVHGFTCVFTQDYAGMHLYCSCFRRLPCSLLPAGQTMVVKLYYGQRLIGYDDVKCQGVVTHVEVRQEYCGI